MGCFAIERTGGVLDCTVRMRDRVKHRRCGAWRRRSRTGGEQRVFYGADRARTLKIERTGTTVTERTHYVGSVEVVYEGALPASNAGAFRRYIGGVAIATFYKATGIDQTRYQHTDHLGSLTALSDAGGQIAAQMAFDPWGQRRNGNDWNTVWQQWTLGMTPVWAQSAIDITPRGYTGHEHVDEMGIIHMNGRIYDALLGRFLQADPFVEDATTLNRYTYVHNNPLSLTDPSGFFSFKKAFRTIASVAIAVGAGILTAGASTALQGFLFATLGGALSGGIAVGSIEGALWGAFSGAVFFGVGQGFAGSLGEGQGVFGSTFKSGELVRASVAHGLAGGTISEMQGGKFGHGFLSAGISKAATPMAVGVSDQVYIQGAAVAIVGGTTSEISGGKFANGAVTAAMAFAFNHCATTGNCRSANEATGSVFDSLEELESVVSGSAGLVRDNFLGTSVSIDLETNSVESTLFEFDALSVKVDGDGAFVEAAIIGIKKGGEKVSLSAGLVGNSRLQFRVEAAAKACAPNYFCGKVGGSISLNAMARNAGVAQRNFQAVTKPVIINDSLRGRRPMIPIQCKLFPETC